MGKNFETKRAIVNLLAAHKLTLTGISNHVGLSPSTTKQHLEELRVIGAVRFVDDIHLTKYKYYEPVPYMTLERCGIPEHGRRLVIRPVMIA